MPLSGYQYGIDPRCSDEEARLLILDEFDKARQKFERLRAKLDEALASATTCDRPRIPENVRIEL